MMLGRDGLPTIGIIGAMIPVLAGCLPVDAGGQPKTAAEEIEDQVDQAGEGIPTGAIMVSDGVYAVPVGVDADGCEQFSQWSTLGATQPVIIFRDGNGGFSPIKSDDYSCNAEMVDMGLDADGCGMFRAEQPDGTVTDIVYYRADNGGFTANPNNALCEG